MPDPDSESLDPRKAQEAALERAMLEADEADLPKIPGAPEVPPAAGPRPESGLQITEEGGPGDSGGGGEGDTSSLRSLLVAIHAELEEFHESVRQGLFLD